MSLKIIGTGVGRTGTHSLKIALNELGFGPCYHMLEVITEKPEHMRLWDNVLHDNPDWNSIFKSYKSTVDWPSSTYFRELYDCYPEAKFVLTVRNPKDWAKSFSETIDLILKAKADAPAPIQYWHNIAQHTIERCGFKIGSKPEQFVKSFLEHTEAVKATIPEKQLLVFDVKDGWGPLCKFLDCEPPDAPFPKTMSYNEFWDTVKGTT